MAERRRWERSAAPLTAAEAKGEDADPVLQRQRQYIKILEERNRLRRRLAETQQRKKERLQEREEAFTTAFNVPAGASGAPRKARTAGSLLGAKAVEGAAEQCRSAPAVALNSGGADRPRAKSAGRAKWAKPQGPMTLAAKTDVEGRTQYMLAERRAAAAEEKEEEEEEEESYLEESFEEFDSDGDEVSLGGEQRRSSDNAKEIVIDESIEEEHTSASTFKYEVKLDSNSADTASRLSTAQLQQQHAPANLSRTTQNLMGLIEGLSRSKQHALMDVLHKFQASQQRDTDVAELRNSVGDPEIWRQLTATLFSQDGRWSQPPRELSGNANPLVTSKSAVDQVLEEHRRWEEQYAQEMKERLTKEREAKEAALKEAEARRMAMLKQLEEEEKEIERLMEIKRQQRLAKLRALEAQLDEEDISMSGAKESVKYPHVSVPSADPKLRSESKIASAKPIDGDDVVDGASTPAMIHDRDGVVNDAKYESHIKSPPVVPPLKLSPSLSSPVIKASATDLKHVEVRVKLMSTWARTRVVGLTQITPYDSMGAELEVDASTLRLYDHADGKPLPKANDMVRGLQRLFNGIAHTNSDQDMWLGRLPDSGVLQIAFELETTPAKLCIWNYNSKTCSACARDVEVLVNGKCMWTGSLPESYGDENDNPCTWISIGGPKKTTRSTTVLEKSSAASNTIAPITSNAKAQTAREPLQPRDAGPPAKDDGPLWLMSSTSGSQTTRAPETKELRLNGSKVVDSDMSESKFVSGSLTSRRRHQLDSKELGASEAKPYCGQSKEQDWVSRIDESYNSRVQVARQRDDAAGTKSTSNPDSHVSVVEAWDSLERFSKTNRSRLPVPTNDRDEDAKSSQSTSSAIIGGSGGTMKRTTSKLLEELRGGSITSTSYHSLPLTSAQLEINQPTRVQQPVIEVPVLPSGLWIKLDILSTWGDPYYVGLNGIEVFDHRGELVSFRDPDRQVTACPESVNVLEENHDDPRVPRNLVDGVNFTCDDYHMWLAPFTSDGCPHYVVLEMNHPVSISMVRIWNYNKCRTHTARGVRNARLILSDYRLDGQSESGLVIFEGEICQAPGIVSSGSFENSNEVILFTREPAILAAIEANDAVLKAFAQELEEEEEATLAHFEVQERPKTSNKKRDESPSEDSFNDGAERRGRPMTSASSRPVLNSQSARKNDEPQQRSSVLPKVIEDAELDDGNVDERRYDSVEEDDQYLVRGQRLVLRPMTTWGDRNYIGLTQVDVLVGANAVPYRLDVARVDASPRDLESLGYHGDPRTLDKLIDGVGTTCDDTHMWLVPLQEGVRVTIDLGTPQYIFGIRVWNYNKSLDDAARGVKQLQITLDGKLLSPPETGFVLRKALGTALFDFSQEIRFVSAKEDDRLVAYAERVRPPPPARAYRTPVVRQDYEPPLFPQGFVLKLVIWSSWGDPYYVGLNGLELFDASGRKIKDAPRTVAAVPSSVAEMAGGDPSDSRVPSNLLSGRNKNVREAHDAWLAPLSSSLRSSSGGSNAGNIVYLVFDEPIVLSFIKLWNYAKTPERGARELDVFLDDLLVFSGTLRRVPDDCGSLKRSTMDDFSQPVLFTNNQAHVDAEKRRILYCGAEEQDVLCINEGQVMKESKAMYRRPDPGAEGVVVDLSQRPMTAMSRQ